MEQILGEIRMFAGVFASMNWTYCNGRLLNVNPIGVDDPEPVSNAQPYALGNIICLMGGVYPVRG